MSEKQKPTLADYELVLVGLRASCAEVCSYATPGAPGTGCYGQCHRNIGDFEDGEIDNMCAVVMAIKAAISQ